MDATPATEDSQYLDDIIEMDIWNSADYVERDGAALEAFHLFQQDGQTVVSNDGVDSFNSSFRSVATSSVTSAATRPATTTTPSASRKYTQPLPSISTIYEPKFLEIYLSYQQHLHEHFHEIQEVILAWDQKSLEVLQSHTKSCLSGSLSGAVGQDGSSRFWPKTYEIDRSLSLFPLCLSHLITFSNWVRDSAINAWVKTTLFDNPDLRPEVRNGLAMIMVYTFAAGKSDLQRSLNVSCDMFQVIADVEDGLGK